METSFEEIDNNKITLFNELNEEIISRANYIFDVLVDYLEYHINSAIEGIEIYENTIEIKYFRTNFDIHETSSLFIPLNVVSSTETMNKFIKEYKEKNSKMK